MQKSRFNEEPIVGILREQEAGSTTAEVCRRQGVSEQTFYRWKSKYGGMGVSDAHRLKSLEDENRRLKKLLAESILDVAALNDLPAKKMRVLAARREATLRLMAEHGPSQRRAFRLVEVDAKTVRRKRRADAQEVWQRLRELAGERHRFGYRRLGVPLAREGMAT